MDIEWFVNYLTVALQHPKLSMNDRQWIESELPSIQDGTFYEEDYHALMEVASKYHSSDYDPDYEPGIGGALDGVVDARPGVTDLAIDWCDVPAGTYVVGSDDTDKPLLSHEKPRQSVTLPAFQISRYLVTNAHWRQFMQAGGYTDQRWWTAQGWAARQEGWEYSKVEGKWKLTNIPWTQPRQWTNPEFNSSNQPVVGVSWHEAVAFCAWLSGLLGTLISLPTEAQWEVAARGPQRPIYPWGDTWDVTKANAHSSHKATTIVGSYPQGASWCGALDMTGNVDEWTCSDYHDPDRLNQIDTLTKSTYVAIRGGSWATIDQWAYCAYRGYQYPRNGTDDAGIRLVNHLIQVEQLPDQEDMRDELQEEHDTSHSLALQEELVAGWLASDGQHQAYAMWNTRTGDRWRAAMVAVSTQLWINNQIAKVGIPWVEMLISPYAPSIGTKPPTLKSPRQRQRDALLAYACYCAWDGRAAVRNRDSTELDALEDTMIAALLTVMSADPLAPTTERLEAGAALGILGDPRPGVTDLAIDWCDVPAGTYLLGNDNPDPRAYNGNYVRQSVTLPAFQISRYLVTNAHWRQFMEAGGYTNQQWWSAEGWAACQEGWAFATWRWEPTGIPWTQPGYWADPHFNGANQPVVGVAWHEAVAFCVWLSAQSGTLVMLPTEAQWEVAARGPLRSIYAWGDTWDAENANTLESSLEAPSAVGSYPQGASWCGALDMTGNVWEFIDSDRSDPLKRVTDLTKETEIIARGGAWYSNRREARCDTRILSEPTIRNGGLRLVARSAEGLQDQATARD